MNKSRSYISAVLFGTSAAVILAFQNCAPVAFENSEQASTSLAKVKDCEDIGKKHSDTWSTSKDIPQPVLCPDGQTLTQIMTEEETWRCADGEVESTGITQIASQQAPNCPMLTVSAMFAPQSVSDGGSTTLKVQTQHATEASYICKGLASGSTYNRSGNLTVGTSSVSFVNVKEEIECTVNAKSKTQSASKKASLALSCKDTYKVYDAATRSCKPYTCVGTPQLLALPTDGTPLVVPPRNGDGACYAVKLMNQIPKASSTGSRDSQVWSRSHGADYVSTTNPFILGAKKFDFIFKDGGFGARTIMLSGTEKGTQVKVDNYVLVGLSKKTAGLPVSSYRALGSKDSVITGTDYIKFKDTPIPFTPFASTGTDSWVSVDITNMVTAEEVHSIDVRALDCGGDRELSDIYLVFQ